MPHDDAGRAVVACDQGGHGRDADGASWFSPVVPLPPSLSEPTTKMDPKQRAAWHCRAPRGPWRTCGDRSRSVRRSVGRDRRVNFNGLCLLPPRAAPPPPELPRIGADPKSESPPITLSGLSARVSDTATRSTNGVRPGSLVVCHCHIMSQLYNGEICGRGTNACVI